MIRAFRPISRSPPRIDADLLRRVATRTTVHLPQRESGGSRRFIWRKRASAKQERSMSSCAARRSSFRAPFALFLAVCSLLAAGALLAEDRPFRKWDKPLPQDVECRLVHWNDRSIFLETSMRRYHSLRWYELSLADQAYVRQAKGEGNEPSPIDERQASMEPIPLFYPNGAYASPRIPVCFNGRYLICADPDGKTLYSAVHASREFTFETQAELIKRFGSRLSVGRQYSHAFDSGKPPAIAVA